MIGFFLFVYSIWLFKYKSKRWLSFFICIFLVTGGFQLVPYELLILPSFGVTKSFDWTLFSFFIICTSNIQLTKNNFQILKEAIPGVRYFLYILLIVILYNVIFVDVEIQILLRVTRYLLFIFIFIPFLNLTVGDYEKVIKYTVVLTTFASTFYILQPFVGMPLLNVYGGGTDSVVFNSDGPLTRYYNSPLLLFPAILIILLLNKKTQFFSTSTSRVILVVNIIALLFTQHRNLIVFLIISILMIYVFRWRLSGLKIILFTLFASTLLVFSLGIIGGRLSAGLDDIQNVFGRNYGKEAQDELVIEHASTLDFRLFHFAERFEYVSQNLDSFLLGVGLINEDSQIVKKLNFKVGLRNKDTGRVVQVDTADIYWSLIVVQMGILGVLSILFFLLRTTARYYTFGYKGDLISQVIFIYLAELLFTSFFSISLYFITTYAMISILLSYFYAKNSKSKLVM